MQVKLGVTKVGDKKNVKPTGKNRARMTQEQGQENATQIRQTKGASMELQSEEVEHASDKSTRAKKKKKSKEQVTGEDTAEVEPTQESPKKSAISGLTSEEMQEQLMLAKSEKKQFRLSMLNICT